MADPVSKAEYKAKAEGMQKAHNIAIADFYHAPEIRRVETESIKTTQTMIIHAIDDFKVVEVSVEVYDMEGVQLEKGQAGEKSLWFWEYRINTDISLHKGLRLLVTAFDKPGNKTTQELEITLS